MSSDSSSGGWLTMQLWYGMFYMHRYKQCSRKKSLFAILSTYYTTVFLTMNPWVRNM